MRRHGFDPFSLVAGLLFGFLALFFLTDHTTSDLAWPWAAVIPLVAVGALIVLYGLRRAFAPESGSDPGPEAEPEPGPELDAEPRPLD